MLIIDEIHAMLSGTFREQRIFLNCLRFLANDLHLPLVYVGTHEAKQALMTDQQLADRFEARELPVWRDDTAFHQLLATFGSTLPLRKASGLREARLRKRILNLTDGVTVRICRLLEEAAVQAIVSGGEQIELDTLSEEAVTASQAWCQARGAIALPPELSGRGKKVACPFAGTPAAVRHCG